jgi:predicted transcriptional regulator
MTDHDTVSEMLPLFKALADQNRLRIIGLLSQHAYAVEELAEALGVSPSTASHHLAVLAKAELVVAKAEGYYSIYSLQVFPLQEMAKRLLHREDLRTLVADGPGDPFRRKVLATFTTREGKIAAFPAQERKFLVLVEYVLNEFEPGVRYTEKRVNEILKKFNEDTARLRRALVDYHYMAREGGGGKYWRIDGALPHRRDESKGR